MYERDVQCEKIPWNNNFLDNSKEKLRICYIDTVEDNEPTLGVKNAQKIVLDKLKKAGHHVEKIPVETWKEPTWLELMFNNKYLSIQLMRLMNDCLKDNF